MIDFDQTVPVSRDWGFGGEVDTLAMTRDKSGDRGSGFLELGAQTHL